MPDVPFTSAVGSMLTRVCSAVVALAAAALLGCASEPAPDDGKLRVVCTTGYVADILREVGGSRVEIETLMGPGVDPHLYKATPSDRRALNRAQVVFSNGLHLEGRLADLLEKLGQRQPVFFLADVLVERHAERLRKVGESEVYDPHVWFDVSLWSLCVGYAAEKLAEVDPEGADEYRANATRYQAELARLDDHVRQTVAAIPKTRRVLVTAHDAFGYFGRAYEIEVRALQGINTADEADLVAVNRLVDLLVDRGVKAVFVESSVPRRNVEALVQGCAARGHAVTIGGELYSDALGPADSPQATYPGVVRHNAATLRAGLE